MEDHKRMTATRWWHPGPQQDSLDNFLLDVCGDSQKDVTAAFLALHRAGARRLVALSTDPLVDHSQLSQALSAVRSDLEPRLRVSLSRTLGDHKYAALVARDWFTDANKGAEDAFSRLTANRVPPSVAISRIVHIYGVPFRYLAPFLSSSSPITANPQAVEAAGDKVLMETANKLASAEADGIVRKQKTLVAAPDWDPRSHPRDEVGRFTITADRPAPAQLDEATIAEIEQALAGTHQVESLSLAMSERKKKKPAPAATAPSATAPAKPAVQAPALTRPAIGEPALRARVFQVANQQAKAKPKVKAQLQAEIKTAVATPTQAPAKAPTKPQTASDPLTPAKLNIQQNDNVVILTPDSADDVLSMIAPAMAVNSEAVMSGAAFDIRVPHDLSWSAMVGRAPTSRPNPHRDQLVAQMIGQEASQIQTAHEQRIQEQVKEWRQQYGQSGGVPADTEDRPQHVVVVLDPHSQIIGAQAGERATVRLERLMPIHDMAEMSGVTMPAGIPEGSEVWIIRAE